MKGGRLLHRLDAVLNERGHQVVLSIVGGANMALAVDARRSTTDVDAVVKRGFDVVFKAAAEVARTEPGLAPDWLNTEFTGGTPDGGPAWSFFDNRDDDKPSTFFTGTSLTVELASPEMMLALKTLAGRDRDMKDIFGLMRMTGIRTPRELGRNLVRFTGPRIIHEQQSPWMPHHIDPSFKFILDNAPDDLRPTPIPKSRISSAGSSRRGLLPQPDARSPTREFQDSKSATDASRSFDLIRRRLRDPKSTAIPSRAERPPVVPRREPRHRLTWQPFCCPNQYCTCSVYEIHGSIVYETIGR